jgi:peroxisomal enoyl-CoA hydratase 2
VIDTSAEPMFGDIPGAPPLDESRGVDGEKFFKLLRPLPVKSVDDTLEIRTKILGVYDKGRSGTVVERMISLVDKRTGEPYSIEIGSAFFLGQGGWGGPKGNIHSSTCAPSSLSS